MTLRLQNQDEPRHAGPRITATRVNDRHSRLNPTLVRRVVRPTTVADLQRRVRGAALRGEPISIAGGRHAMGGQQFGTGSVLVDTTGLDHILHLDPRRGTVEVEAGIQWPALVRWLVASQGDRAGTWGIRQKQTGADRLSLGGALAANIHGRGLSSAPIVDDVESFTLVDPRGDLVPCSRDENAELFRSVLGGYGLFGIVATVTLRLARRHKLVRLVREPDVDDALPLFKEALAAGAEFGDMQLAIDPSSADFLRRGILSTYHPISDATPVPTGQLALGEADWKHLLRLAHFDKSRGFREYADHYRATSGQVYWSDLHQLGTYVDGYHDEIDQACGATGSEMISELFVPRSELPRFLELARTRLREHSADVIYATVRLIERDTETLLPWARAPWACTVLNLHTAHTPQAVERTREAFRALIDGALSLGGSFYLTYHRWATPEQVEAGHPGFRDMLARKLAWDPDERFTSDWYRYHANELGFRE